MLLPDARPHAFSLDGINGRERPAQSDGFLSDAQQAFVGTVPLSSAGSRSRAGGRGTKAGKLCRALRLYLANPVRAGLVELDEQWPFRGVVVPGYPKLNADSHEFWEIFWKLYYELRAPNAGSKRLLPRRSG